VFTEITDITDFEGTLFYDADCRFCVRLADWGRPSLAGRGFRLLPLQTPGCGERLGRTNAELLAEIWLLLPGGKSLGGADALVEISRHFWWAWPVSFLALVPGAMGVFRAIYYWVARHRYCSGGACAVRRPNGAVAVRSASAASVLPLLILPLVVQSIRHHVAAWVFMWLMAFGLYAGCKWLTYCEAIRKGIRPVRWRSLGYLWAWPGMDAERFLDRAVAPVGPRPAEWFGAGGKILLGAVLLWGVARMALPGHPLLAGWIGMTGAILVLHFGWFQLLALTWRRAGVEATPLMDKPTHAKSLAEFWGRRWNTAFNELAFRFTFRPLSRRTNPRIAMLLVFGLSGLVHELVISLPARGGYGLPTAYFLIQGMGMLAERSPAGKRIGLGGGWRGWLFTLLITAGPAFWLFHPPFIKNIILPMLAAIGAT
jgi:alginate O-acetyltransferase complex protein AlgI